jgi:hypothetical protein
MKHFRTWAEGKNPLLVILALQIAGFAKDYLLVADSIKKDKRLEGDVSLPSLRRWLKLYQNPKKVGRILFDALEGISDHSEKIVGIAKELASGAEKLQKMPLGTINKFWAQLSPEERTRLFHDGLNKLEEYKELLINDYLTEPTEGEKTAFRKNLIKPEIIFFFRVTIPCFSLYGIYPIRLLKMAQQGDDDALEKLIRLDKSTIFDPQISEIIHHAQTLRERRKLSLIKMAFSLSPKVKTDMRAIKCNLGGLISHTSISIKQKLPAIKIRQLYDALARDTGLDYIDPDLGDMTPENFEKAIQRGRIFWQKILQADKK